MIVAKKFKNYKEITDWLADKDNNVSRLKRMYTPKKYKAILNFDDKQIEITKKS